MEKLKVRKTDDPLLRVAIESALKANDFYCPCRLEHCPDNKCMCKEFRDQIKRGEAGYCHCGLYEAYHD